MSILALLMCADGQHIFDVCWWTTLDRYNWNRAKFPDVPRLIKEMAPTKLILWEHPVLDATPTGCTHIINTSSGQ